MKILVKFFLVTTIILSFLVGYSFFLKGCTPEAALSMWVLGFVTTCFAVWAVVES